ncbi:MAG: adenosylhomocysteinase [Candidatus Helarchaeota archaeon]|nr:adenosylhomocysteinase [Candidatus Helarchaeota archaeon]
MNLAPQGKLAIEWSAANMPVVMKIQERFKKEKPLKNLKLGVCLHVTKETANLVLTLKAGGAEVALCASNPLSTQDEVAAALVEEGIKVFAWRENHDEYYWCVNKVLDIEPNITLDDGADLINVAHTERQNLIENFIGGCEETTTGVIRLRAMAKDGVLKYPIIAINDAETKWDFDNIYGTGQSTMDGILRATSVMIAGKKFVVAGYGHCSKGIAMRARGLGAHVIVTEINPVKALRATMDGFWVMGMKEAAKIADIIVSSTGNKDVVSSEHIDVLKDGVLLANSGHFNVEINIPDLEAASSGKRKIKPNVEEFTLKDGRKVYLLAEGRLVNLAAAEGHPSEVMDMSFANQSLCTEYLVKKGKELKPDVYKVPIEIDNKVAALKLESMGIQIDKLTPEQEKYLTSYDEGT